MRDEIKWVIWCDSCFLSGSDFKLCLSDNSLVACCILFDCIESVIPVKVYQWSLCHSVNVPSVAVLLFRVSQVAVTVSMYHTVITLCERPQGYWVKPPPSGLPITVTLCYYVSHLCHGAISMPTLPATCICHSVTVPCVTASVIFILLYYSGWTGVAPGSWQVKSSPHTPGGSESSTFWTLLSRVITWLCMHFFSSE